MVYVDRRGHYKFFTRKQIIKLSLMNEKKIIKNMDLITPLHNKNFPDYKGKLLKAYDSQKKEGVDNILDEVIEMNKPKETNKKKEEIIKYAIRKYNKGKKTTFQEVADDIKKEYKGYTVHLDTVRRWVNNSALDS